MEIGSSAPVNDDSLSGSAPAANPPQGSEEPNSGPAPSMSGALQEEDAKVSKDSPETTDDNEGQSATNGTVQVPVEAPDTVVQPADSALLESDSVMKDSTAFAATSDASVEANGTPATSKRPHNGKRKSSSGVPEHKTKKLNKKKSLPKITHLDAQPGEYYFARLKSYPPWPAIICDEGMLPQSLLSTRPVTTKQEDGTYKEAYDDGGKRVHDRTFPIMFLHTNEFAWLPNTELSELDPEECKDVSEKGKAKSLIQAYRVAAEGHGLDHFKAMLLDHQKALQEDLDRREARESAKVQKAERAEKKKRQSEAAEDDEDVEMEDVEEESKSEPKKSAKKRKKEVESDGEGEKPAKTPKTATKLKLTTPKAPGTTEKKTKETSKASKPKSERKKSKAVASDDEVVEADVKEPEKELDAGEAKTKKEKEGKSHTLLVQNTGLQSTVLFLRHKLQKGFLSRDQAPQENEMATMSNFISKLENYGDLEVSIIRSTKINKVLKALIKLNTIPKDEEFNFKSRSVELLGRWNKALGAESTVDENAGTLGTDKEEQPITNGVHKLDKESSEEKRDAPSTGTDAVQGTETSPDASVDAKEALVDKTTDEDAASTAIAQEGEEPVDEHTADAD